MRGKEGKAMGGETLCSSKIPLNRPMSRCDENDCHPLCSRHCRCLVAAVQRVTCSVVDRSLRCSGTKPMPRSAPLK